MVEDTGAKNAQGDDDDPIFSCISHLFGLRAQFGLGRIIKIRCRAFIVTASAEEVPNPDIMEIVNAGRR